MIKSSMSAEGATQMDRRGTSMNRAFSANGFAIPHPGALPQAEMNTRAFGAKAILGLRSSETSETLVPLMESTPPPPTSSSSADVRTWNVLCHASALLGFFFPWAGHILAPLIVWLVKRGDSPEIDAHGKESINFQLSMLIYSVISGILCLVLIGFVLLAILHVLNVVFVIIASIRASEGNFYRYPLTIRFLS
jgi:uncharacterized protein